MNLNYGKALTEDSEGDQLSLEWDARVDNTPT